MHEISSYAAHAHGSSIGVRTWLDEQCRLCRDAQHVGARERRRTPRRSDRSLELEPRRQDRGDRHPGQPDGDQARDRRAAGDVPDLVSLRPDLHARLHEGRVPDRPHRRAQGRSEPAPRSRRRTGTSRPTRASIYGTGFTPDVSILLYNKELFRKAGLDPEKPPTTHGARSRNTPRRSTRSATTPTATTSRAPARAATSSPVADDVGLGCA